MVSYGKGGSINLLPTACFRHRFELTTVSHFSGANFVEVHFRRLKRRINFFPPYKHCYHPQEPLLTFERPFPHSMLINRSSLVDVRTSFLNFCF